MRALFSLLCSLVIVSPASATILLAKDFDALVSEAQGVVEATVQRVESREDAKGNINTFVTLGAIDVLAGSYGEKELMLRLEGGFVDGRGLAIEGSPEFSAKERVILFVRGNGSDMVPLVGWTQGVFRVLSEPKSGRQTVVDHDGNRVFGVRGAEILKEQRSGPSASLLDPVTGELLGADSFDASGEQGGGLTRGFSSTVPAGAGTSDDPGAEPPRAKKADPSVRAQAVAADEFRRAIRERAGRLSKAKGSIQSVDVYEFETYGASGDVRDEVPLGPMRIRATGEPPADKPTLPQRSGTRRMRVQRR